MKKVGCSKLDDDLVDYLLAEGFIWSTERQCYYMPHSQFQHWNNKPLENKPHSFEVDAFHRAVNLPYGGDCHAKSLI